MSTGADTHEPQPHGEDGAPGDAIAAGEVVRLLPINVLVLSADRYFRTAATMLLSRRGCSVLSAADEEEALAATLLGAVDVLVAELPAPAEDHVRCAREIGRRIDAAGVAAGRRVASIGVVLVGEPAQLGEAAEAEAGTRDPALSKWGPFERLYQAISDQDRARRLPAPADSAPWPRSARRSGTV